MSSFGDDDDSLFAQNSHDSVFRSNGSTRSPELLGVLGADDPSHVNETTEEPINKKVKKEDVSPDDFPVKINTLLDNGESQLEAKQESMKCANCNISFVNAATFKAHVNFYCKKRDPSQE